MRIVKRICAFLLAVIMTACGILELAPLEAYAAAASNTTVVKNKYIQYTMNRSTGGFSIDTLEGHPQKKYDDNLPLLYKESGEGMETSYVTFRIKEEGSYSDYIFGQDYSWLLGEGAGKLTVSEPVEDGDSTILTADWEILGFTVTQTVALSQDDTGSSSTNGNVGISYTIQNNNGDSREAGLRVLLDTALSNQIDAPYIMTDDTNYSPVEIAYTDEKMPTQFRGVDSLTSPTRMCYAILNGWEGREADKVIAGHWANLANTRYDYTPNPSCDYTNRSNKYITADSALALYWSPQNIAAGEASTCQFLYGVGNFTSELTGKKVNINMTVGGVKLKEGADGISGGYENDGIFEVEATIDNTVTDAEELKAASVTLGLETGLSCVADAAEGFETGTEISLGDIKPGETVTKKFRVKAEPQQEITAKAVSISLNTANQVNELANRYVILPNALGGAAEVKFSGVTPETIYEEGDRSFALTGDFKAFKALKGNSGWELELVSTQEGGKSYPINKSDISFDKETYQNMSAIVRDKMDVGVYRPVFTFNESKLIESFGKTLDSGLELNVSADEKFKDPNYGIISLVRYDTSQYGFVAFRNEGEYNDFLHGEKEATIDDGIGKVTLSKYDYVDPENTKREILATLRGKITAAKQQNGSLRYIVSSSAEGSNVTLNNCISCANNVELYYEAEGEKFNRDESYTAVIEGDGEIRVINSICFWKKEWSIEAPKNTQVTMQDPGDGEEWSISLGGAAQMIQSIGGLIVDLKYGVLTSEVLEKDGSYGFGYGVSFGGSMSIPISVAEPKKTNTDGAGGDNGGTGGSTAGAGGETGGGTPETGGSTGGTGGGTGGADDDEYEPNDGNLLSVEIENILYGEKTLKDSINPFGKGAGSDSGYIGTDATVGVGLPENIMGKLVSNAAGAYATVHVDTIQGIYEVSAGMKVAILECEGTLAFKTVDIDGVDYTLPDTLAFNIADGLRVPIAPPTLFMTGIGGGISELADTIGGNYVKEIPPLTIQVQMALSMVEVLEGDMSAKISGFGMSLDGNIQLAKYKDALKIAGGMSARWIDPFYINVYGNVNVLDIIKGGASITIMSDYFHGYAYVAIVLPDSLPIIGGKELAKVEAAISSSYIGANVKIIGIGLGVIYYFDSGDVDVGGNIDLGQMEQKPDMLSDEVVTFSMDEGTVSYNTEDTLAIQEENVGDSSGEEETYTVVVGSNTHKLDIKQVDKANTKYAPGPRSRVGAAAKTDNKTTWYFNPTSQDTLLIELPFSGNVIPDMAEVTLLDPSGQSIKLVEYSDANPEKGNFMIQERKNKSGYSMGNYLYISITDENQLKAGEWTLSIDNSQVNIKNADINAYGVDQLPELESASMTIPNGEKSLTANLSWSIEGNDSYTGKISCYLNENKDIVKDIQKDAGGQGNGETTEETSDLGILIYEKDCQLVSGSDNVELPDAISSGDYYLVTTVSADKGGIDTVVSENSIKVTNPNLPNPAQEASLKAIGDQKLQLDITGAEEADYDEYYVELIDKDTQEVVASGFYDTEGPIVFGKVIQAAAADDPKTPANEAVEERVLEVGKSYYATVKTSRKYVTDSSNTGETTIEDYEEMKYMGDGQVDSDPVTVPEVTPPKLVSVDVDGLNKPDKDGTVYTRESHIKAVYTFSEPVSKFILRVDGLENMNVTASENNKVWTFEQNMDDGTHMVDFEAVSSTGDTLAGGDGSKGTFGFITDTEAPMLAIGSELRENVSSNTAVTASEDSEETPQVTQLDDQADVSSQSAVTDKDGKYEIIGHTEPDIASWEYSGKGTVVISEDGTFTIKGTAELGDKIYKEETFLVRDKAGNENQVIIYIINGNIEYPDKLVITNDGEEIKETDGVKTVTIKAGELLKLKAVGYNANNEPVVFDDSKVEWDTMYEGNAVNLDAGNVIAKTTGETAIKAVLPYASVAKDNTSAERNTIEEESVSVGPGDFVKIVIKEGSNRTIYFDGGGGTGKAPASITAISGSFVTLPMNTFTKKNLEFEGWSDGVSVYPEGSTMVMPNESIRLIAKWKGEAIVTPTPDPVVPPYNPDVTESPEPEPTETPEETPTVTPTPTPTETPYAGDLSKMTPQIKLKKRGATQVEVSWNKLDEADGYYVYYKTSGGSWKRVDKLDKKTLNYTFKGLSALKNYYFTVKAYRKDGSKYTYSQYKKDFKVMTKPKTPQVKVKAVTATTATISWNAISGAESYRVYYKTAKGGWKRVKNVSSKVKTYTFSKLTSGQKYYFTVRAYGKNLLSDYLTKVNKITLLKTPGVKAKASGNSKVKVTWSKVKGAAQYYVYYRLPGQKWKRTAVKGAGASSYTIKGLKKNKSYLFTVKAVGKVDGKTIYSQYKTDVKAKVK